MYVGHAAFLSRRLRTYSRRAFFVENNSPRDVSSKIAVSLEHGLEIIVFVKLTPTATMSQLKNMEARLIETLHPPWNRQWEEEEIDEYGSL